MKLDARLVRDNKEDKIIHHSIYIVNTSKTCKKIMLEDVKLQHTDSTTYLGVTFDKRQTWRQHIDGAQANARRKLALLRKLAGTQRGVQY